LASWPLGLNDLFHAAAAAAAAKDEPAMRSPVPLRSHRGPAALVAALLIGLLGAAAPTATAAPAPAAAPAAWASAPTAGQKQTFGIQPATAKAPDSRSAYTYEATPGAQLKDHVAVWNYGDQPLTLTLYAADAFNTDTGGYDVLPAGKPSTDVGSWVHLAEATVKLPPRSRQIVPFTLAVPADAAPGDHSGGIVLALRRQTVDAKGNAVTVDQRVGARIHLRVPGALRPGLTVEAVHTVYHGTLNPFGSGSTTTSYTVRNTGNLRLAGRQAVRVRNALGSVVTAKGPAALSELLPGNSTTYTVTVSGVLPVLWQTASITIDPLALPGDADPALASATRSATYATIPWTALAIVAALLLLALGRYRRVRRRRRGPAGGNGASVNGGPPPPVGPVPATPVPPSTATSTTPATATAPPTGGGTTAVAVPVPVPMPVPVPVPAPASSSAASAATATAPAGAATAVPVPVPLVPPTISAPPAVPVPPAAAPTPGTGTESTPGAGRSVGAVLGLLLVGGVALGGLGAAAPRAYADPGPATTASAPATTPATTKGGTLAFDYASGRGDDSIDVLTSGPCPHPGDWVMASLSGPGFPAGGATVVGLSPASIYGVAANGGFVVPLSDTLDTIARQNGVTALHGRYTVDVYCKGRFLPAHFEDFPGTLTVGANGRWTASGKPATALVHGGAGTPAPVQPPPPTLAAPNTSPNTAPVASSSQGVPSDSVAAMVGGGGLLALIGGSYLRRQRSRVRDAHAAAAPPQAPVQEKAARR
jgi:hypothetical protein